jgi:multidrug resistance efflux pump
VDLLQARYAVRRAELQVKRNPLLSDIDARKNILTLEQAKRTLAQTESDVKSRREQAQAQLALARQTRQRYQIELAREQARLRQTKALASMSGLVSIQQNAFGGARQFGAQIPDIREGDTVQPGMAVAQILDVSEMEVVAKIGELDRANLVEGQEVLITLDALAGKKVHGKIKSMSGTATANVMSGDPAKKFEVLFSVDMKELFEAVGATPEQIREVMATAERNRARAATRAASGGGLPGGPPNGGGFPGAGMPEGMMQALAGARGGNLPEGAVQAFAGMRQRGGQGGADAQAGARGGQSGDAGQRQRPGGEGGAPQRGGSDQAAAGQQGQRGGRGGAGGFPGIPGMGMPGRGGSTFTQQDLDNAELPPPPESDTGLQVLLRPGLLADLQVIIEKIPDAIYIPAQAVFERDGKPIGYVKTGERFVERQVQLLKRSESTMVISAGLKPGEQVALVNPTREAAKKKEAPKSGGASPVSGALGGSKS